MEASRVKVIDQSQVAPPPGSVSTTTVPLTFFDILWLSCNTMQRIFFYELPYPALHYTQTVLPRLKESLSLTLRHFFPFAAKLMCPPPPHQPYIVYNEGDAVQVTVAESDADLLNHFVGNHARDVKTLKSFFPELSFVSLASNDTQVAPNMAIQFTVFPNSGISIGVTFNHVAADGRSVQHFMKSWAAIHRSQREDLTSFSLPYCKRDVIKDTQGLSSVLLKDLRNINTEDHLLRDFGGDVLADNVLTTFTMKRAKIEQMKRWITTHSENDDELGQVHMSTYVVTCAFTWVNIMKLREKIRGSSDNDDMLYSLLFGADCRERFELSIPGTYFGNCLTHVCVSVKRRELMGEAGIGIAARAIGRKISELGKGALRGAEKWASNFTEVFKHQRVVTVAGSPKFRVYETDFGWGRPKKSDMVHIPPYSGFSLAENIEDDGGIDIGMVIGLDKLHLLNALFEQ
ncbi:hypothetical protein ACOSQ3_002528 [Xanthoceras sorbifolium]